MLTMNTSLAILDSIKVLGEHEAAALKDLFE